MLKTRISAPSMMGIIVVIIVSLFMTLAFGQEGTKDQLEKQVTNLENTVVELQDTIKSISVEVVQLENKMTNEVESLRPRIATTEGIAKDLTYNYKMMEGKLTKMATTVEELEKLKPKVIDLEETVGKLSEQVTDNKDLIKALRTRVEQSEAQFKTLEESVKNEVAKLQGLEPKVEKLQNTVHGLSSNLQDLKPAVVELRNTVGSISSRVENSEVKISKLEDRVETVSSKLETATTQILQIKKQIEVGEITELRGKVTSIKDAIKNLLIELKSHKKQIYLLEQDIQQIKDSGLGEQIKGAIDKNTSAVQSLNQAVEALDERVSTNENKIKSANSMATIGLLGGLAAIVVALVMGS